MRRFGLGAAFVVSTVCRHGAAGDLAPFTEESAARNLFYTTSFQGSLTWGYGLCFADLDNDGDPDLVTVGAASGFPGIWENDGAGNFTSRTFTSGIPASTAYSNVTAADVDGDGDLDLLFGEWGFPNRLMRNDGGFTFTDISPQSGMADPGLSSTVAWGDYDGDGAIDAYIANREFVNPRNNVLCRNLGDGTFVDVAPDLGVDYDQAMTLAVSLFDYDRDGDQDIYVGNDRGLALGCGWPNRLWRNDGGTFTDVSVPSGSELCFDAMSTAIGDFDGNLWPDIYVTNVDDGNALLLNQGDGTFVESAVLTGTVSYAWAWGAQFLDFDNDGLLDLFVCNERTADRLYRNTGAWPAEDVAAAAGVGFTGPSFTVAYADIDADGDLDMAVSQQWGRLLLYINNEGQRRNWLRIIPVDARGLPAGGAEAEVSAGGVTRYAQLVHNAGYKSQNEHVLHFGLGDLAQAEQVVVTWPGRGSRTLTDVAANQVLELSFCPADLTGDGVLDLADISAFVSAFIAGDPAADLNADGVFDLSDLSSFVSTFLAGCP